MILNYRLVKKRVKQRIALAFSDTTPLKRLTLLFYAGVRKADGLKVIPSLFI